MRRRWNPKAWNPPRSRRGRFGAASILEPVGEILKEIWQEGPIEYLRPWWARLSYERGWMSPADYWSLEPEPTGRRIPCVEDLYEASTLLGLVRKGELA